MLAVAGHTGRPVAVNLPHVVDDYGWKQREFAMSKGEFAQVLSDIRSRFYVPTDRSSVPEPEFEFDEPDIDEPAAEDDNGMPDQRAEPEPPPHLKPQRPRTRGRGKRGKKDNKPPRNDPREEPPHPEDV